MRSCRCRISSSVVIAATLVTLLAAVVVVLATALANLVSLTLVRAQAGSARIDTACGARSVAMATGAGCWAPRLRTAGGDGIAAGLILAAQTIPRSRS